VNTYHLWVFKKEFEPPPFLGPSKLRGDDTGLVSP
jgi:hypothetical protein